MSLIISLENADGMDVNLEVFPNDTFQEFIDRASEIVGYAISPASISGDNPVSLTDNIYEYLLSMVALEQEGVQDSDAILPEMAEEEPSSIPLTTDVQMTDFNGIPADVAYDPDNFEQNDEEYTGVIRYDEEGITNDELNSDVNELVSNETDKRCDVNQTQGLDSAEKLKMESDLLNIFNKSAGVVKMLKLSDNYDDVPNENEEELEYLEDYLEEEDEEVEEEVEDETEEGEVVDDSNVDSVSYSGSVSSAANSKISGKSKILDYIKRSRSNSSSQFTSSPKVIKKDQIIKADSIQIKEEPLPMYDSSEDNFTDVEFLDEDILQEDMPKPTVVVKEEDKEPDLEDDIDSYTIVKPLSDEQSNAKGKNKQGGTADSEIDKQLNKILNTAGTDAAENVKSKQKPVYTRRELLALLEGSSDSESDSKRTSRNSTASKSSTYIKQEQLNRNDFSKEFEKIAKMGTSIFNLKSVKAEPSDSARKRKKNEKTVIEESVKKSNRTAFEEIAKKSSKTAVEDTVKKGNKPAVEDSVKKAYKTAVEESVRKGNKPSFEDFVRKSYKPAVEESVKRGNKPAVEEIVKKTYKSAVEDSVKKTYKSAVEDSVKKTYKSAVEDNFKKTYKSAVEDSVKKTSMTAFEKNVTKTERKTAPLAKPAPQKESPTKGWYDDKPISGGYPCRLCNKTFDKLLFAITHTMVHKTPEKSIYPCVLCPYGFTSFPQVRDHMRRDHTGGANIIRHEDKTEKSKPTQRVKKNPPVSTASPAKAASPVEEVQVKQEIEEEWLEDEVEILEEWLDEEVEEIVGAGRVIKSEVSSARSIKEEADDIEDIEEEGYWEDRDEDMDDPEEEIEEEEEDIDDPEESDEHEETDEETVEKERVPRKREDETMFAYSYQQGKKLSKDEAVVWVPYQEDDEEDAPPAEQEETEKPSIMVGNKMKKDGVELYRCALCGNTFTTARRLMYHRGAHQAELLNMNLSCQGCDRDDFKTEASLYDHLNKKHNELFMCMYPYCYKEFQLRASLKVHSYAHGKKKLKCDVCSKQFFNAQCLKEHITVHLKVKPFQCHICLKFLQRRSRLRMHLLSHEAHPRKNSVLTCRHCHMGFRNVEDARDHVLESETCRLSLDPATETDLSSLLPAEHAEDTVEMDLERLLGEGSSEDVNTLEGSQTKSQTLQDITQELENDLSNHTENAVSESEDNRDLVKELSGEIDNDEDIDNSKDVTGEKMGSKGASETGDNASSKDDSEMENITTKSEKRKISGSENISSKRLKKSIADSSRQTKDSTEDNNAEGSNTEDNDAKGNNADDNDAKGSNADDNDAKGSNADDNDAKGSNAEGNDGKGSNIDDDDAEGSNIDDNDAEGSNIDDNDAEGSNTEGDDAEGSDTEDNYAKGKDKKNSAKFLDITERAANFKKVSELLAEVPTPLRVFIGAVQVMMVLRCEYCEKVYCTKDSLNEHRQIHKGKKLPFECNVCRMSFDTFAKVTTHKVSHGFFKVPSLAGGKKDKKNYGHIRETSAAKVSGYNPFPVVKHFLCQICNSTYLHHTYFSTHVRNHHPAPGEATHPCPTCNREYLTFHLLQTHLRRAHGARKRPKLARAANYICMECDKHFSVRSEWLRHNKEMHDEAPAKISGPFACHICEKVYQTKIGLKGHLRMHKGMLYLCSQCGSGFAHQAGLVTHQKRVHMRSYKHKCDKCDQSFYSIGELKNHVRCHTGEKPFPCNYCNLTFRTKARRKEHHMVHTGERPYPCDICGLAFRRSIAMKNHRLIHTGTRPFTCQYCNKKFLLKSILRTHIKRKHSTKFLIMKVKGGALERAALEETLNSLIGVTSEDVQDSAPEDEALKTDIELPLGTVNIPIDGVQDSEMVLTVNPVDGESQYIIYHTDPTVEVDDPNVQKYQMEEFRDEDGQLKYHVKFLS